MSKKKDKSISSNRNVDTLIVEGNFCIEREFAFAELSNYAHELSLLQRGVPFSELGIAERRRRNKASIITLQGGRPALVDMYVANRKGVEIAPNSFAHIKLEGVMRARSGMSSYGADALSTEIQQAFSHENITGIFIEANTGGGEALAGEMLKSVLESSPKAVVVYAHLLCSAGIHATLPADEIIASNNAARIGSIGTMMSVNKRFRDWYNKNYDDLYAEGSGNKNSSFRKFLAGDTSGLVSELNAHNKLFQQEVKNYRPLKGQISQTLSGAVFTAADARKRGLVDGIGGFDYAVKRLQANIDLRKNSQ